jgi:DNA polymerase-3 subunit epsilon
MLERLKLAWARQRCGLPLQQEALARPLPSPRAALAEVELVALDFETTGLDPRRDGIVAAGWVLVRSDRIVLASARELHVRAAAGGVGQSATIHGIVDSDLDQAEDAEAMLRHLLPYLAGRAIVAHAAAIEQGFLDALLIKLGGVRLPHRFIDTLALERRLLELEGRQIREGDLTLEACRARRHLPEHSAHSALADALACAELLLAQVEAMGGASRVRLGDLG